MACLGSSYIFANRSNIAPGKKRGFCSGYLPDEAAFRVSEPTKLKTLEKTEGEVSSIKGESSTSYALRADSLLRTKARPSGFRM
jgi:hypothetical protein